MNQITLRNIPENIYKQLRQLAHKNDTSINKTILYLLKKSFGLEEDVNKKRDLSDLAGTWNRDQAEEFDENIKVFQEIDNEVWNS